MKAKVNYTTKENIYYQLNPDMFQKLVELIENHPTSYNRMLNAKGTKKQLKKNPKYVPPYKDLYNWIDQSLPLLKDPHLSTKCYWILNGLIDFPKCAYRTCQKIFTNVNVQFNRGYQKFCLEHSKCDPTSIEKRKATCRKHYGVDVPMQSKEV